MLHLTDGYPIKLMLLFNRVNRKMCVKLARNEQLVLFNWYLQFLFTHLSLIQRFETICYYRWKTPTFQTAITDTSSVNLRGTVSDIFRLSSIACYRLTSHTGCVIQLQNKNISRFVENHADQDQNGQCTYMYKCMQ